MKKLLAIILFFLHINSWGCINEYRTLLSGEVILTDPTNGKVWTEKIDKEAMRKSSQELLALYQQTKSIEYLSDYGVSLIYLEEFDEAKKVYFDIESKKPDQYATASNLGTLYELIGQPDSALFWIKKSIQLNPESHGGSEWIHIKILEYKISKNKNKSILDLDFGNNSLPENPNHYKLTELQKHLWQQLRERTKFVKPKDEIVGSLYFDLGNILAQIADLEAALESYEAAKEYGFQNELMDKRIGEFESLTRRARYKEKIISFLKNNIAIIFYGGLILMIIIAIYIFYRIFKRKQKQNTTLS